MSRPTSLDDLLRSVDPAAGVDMASDGLAAQRVWHRTMRAAESSRRRKGPVKSGRRWLPRRRLAVVVSVATLVVSGGVVAIADMFTAATPVADQPGYLNACFDADTGCREAVLAEIREHGSDFEQAVAADGLVTASEYALAAEAVVACAEGLRVEAVRSADANGWTYGFMTRQADRDGTIQRCMRAHFDRVHQLWLTQGSNASPQ